MSGCNSDPTAGCENSAIVAAINSCCSSQSAILTDIKTGIDTINTTISSCCASVSSKQDRMIELLEIIANK